MNKVTTINLGGTAYQLEEPGYDKLRAYLNDATAKLGGNPDKDEIILDLERAIAEKCDTYLMRGKNVVSTSEVEQIIKDMGPVHAAEGDEDASASSAASVDSPKRLYRIREGSWILGVCAGLAAYLNVDVALVRIIAIVLLFVTHGGMILAYFIAAIFIHRADTPEKRAAAHGVPFSTQDFIARAYDIRDEVKAQSREWKRYRRSMKRDYRAQYQPHEGWSLIGPVFGLLSVLWVLALLSVITTHTVFGYFLPIGIPLWLTVVVMCIIYAVFLSPLKYLATAHHLNDAGRVWHYNPVTGFLRLILELLVVWFIGWLLYTYVPTVHDFLSMAWMQLNQAGWWR